MPPEDGGCGWGFWSSFAQDPYGLRGLVGLLFEICIVDASIWQYLVHRDGRPFRGGALLGVAGVVESNSFNEFVVDAARFSCWVVSCRLRL